MEKNSNTKYLIAICGKSASGKDTLARGLSRELGYNLIVKDTSRPSRHNETHGQDYYFVDSQDIYGNEELYMCRSVFRGWAYGTRISELKDGVNVGVFSPIDLLQIKDTLKDENVIIIPVYLDINKKVRRARAIDRNRGRISFEILRREFTDDKDFSNIDSIIRTFFPAYVKYYGNTVQYRECFDTNTRYRYDGQLNNIILDIVEKSRAFSHN